MDYEYKISCDQLGKDYHSKVYIIQENNTRTELIVKIYEDSRHEHYNNEKNTLSLLKTIHQNKEKNFFVIFKDMQYNPHMFIIPKEVKGFNLEYLFYDYLSKLSLLDYLNHINEQKKEIYAKFLCYKLLLAIELLHSIDICHNKLDISNIMFDDDFNPKIIHFSEANIINDKIKLNKDLFDLAKILAKLFSLGKFHSINYSKKNQAYIIYGIVGDKKIQIEETKFWKNMKNLYNINISAEFLEFFHIILNAKKFKELVNIKDLLNNKWLSELSQDIESYENNFKKDFKILYETIIEDNIKQNSINVDIKNILDENKNEINISNELKYPEKKRLKN